MHDYGPCYGAADTHRGKQTACGGHTCERIVADEAKDFGFENKLMFAELKRLVYLCPK